MAPRGLLFDYGGTLIEETGVDLRAGQEWLLARASYVPEHVTKEAVHARAARVTAEVSSQRDRTHLETPWPALTRLIHEPFGIRFDASMAELSLGFLNASVRTREMPGARDALAQFHAAGLPMAVVSNTAFGEHVIRSVIARHGLADHMAFVMVSADYAVRKPNVLLFEVAAARLGLEPRDIWFVGDRLDTDVAGAKAAGMTAVWFNHDGRDDGSSPADLTVRSWSELQRHVFGADAVGA